MDIHRDELAKNNLTEKDIDLLSNPQNSKYREILSELIEQFSPNGIGVEIGVLRAETSRYILCHTSTKHLYLVDPWLVYSQKGHRDILKNQSRADSLYLSVIKIMRNHFKEQNTIFRDSIEMVAELLPTLDFAFIDGNHSYDAVLTDLDCLVPKIRSKGLIMGHDWSSHKPGVISAVTDYFSEEKDKFFPPFSSSKDMACYLENQNNNQLLLPFISYELKHSHCPAPSAKPIVNKSWPHGNLWWMIKR